MQSYIFMFYDDEGLKMTSTVRTCCLGDVTSEYTKNKGCVDGINFLFTWGLVGILICLTIIKQWYTVLCTTLCLHMHLLIRLWVCEFVALNVDNWHVTFLWKSVWNVPEKIMCLHDKLIMRYNSSTHYNYWHFLLKTLVLHTQDLKMSRCKMV